MAIKKIEMRPEGTNDYGDILYPKTSADMVVETATQKIMTSAERTKLAGIPTGVNNYIHPTTAGNKHIPSGGSNGQFLAYGGSSGVAKWEDIQTERKLTEGLNKYVSIAQGYTMGIEEYRGLENDEPEYNPQFYKSGATATTEGTIVADLPIDLTGWNYVEAVVKPVKTNYISNIYLIVSTNKIGSSDTYDKRTIYTTMKAGTNSVSVILPISEISGNQYIRVHGKKSETSNFMGLELLSLKLSK